MASNPAVPFYDNGSEITCVAGAGGVTGKRFVKVLGAAVGETQIVVLPAAGDKVLGVAGFDAAAGEFVTVYRLPNVMPVTAGAALTAGQEVQTDGTGKAIVLAAGKPAGSVMIDAANGADAKVALSA